MTSKIRLKRHSFVFAMSFLTLCLLFVISLPGTSAQAAEEIVLKFTTLDSPNSMIGRGQDWYLKRVEELSKGRIKFQRHWSSSLVPPRETLDALTSGVADVAFVIPQFTPGKLPLLTVQTLPTNLDDLWIVGKAMDDYNQEPYIKEELARRKAVYLTTMPLPVYNLLLKQTVTSIDQLKGLKIWASGGQASLVKAMGAVPVTIPTPEVFTALERGTIDGAAFPPLLMVDFGMYEAGKYVWKLPLGIKSSLLAIKSDVWNGLPADLRKIMRDTTPESLEYGAGYHRIVQIDGNNKQAGAKLKEAGIVVAEASESAKAQVRAMAAPLWKEWAEKMEAKGFPGQQAATKFRSLLDKYAAEIPK